MAFPPSPLPATEPPRDCPLCPRLVAFRGELRVEHPDWWNAPVPAWGDPTAWLAIVGLILSGVVFAGSRGLLGGGLVGICSTICGKLGHAITWGWTTSRKLKALRAEVA